MNSHVLRLAERVIRGADREHPADHVLRTALRGQRGFSREDSAEVSRAVFAYYRWMGWLNKDKPLQSQVEHALRLTESFAKNPQLIPDTELVERAVPGWVRNEITVSPAWARELQTAPKLWLRARPGQGRGLAAILGDCVTFGEGALADILEYRGQVDLFRTPEFQAGNFELQDLSSQAVGLLCSPEPGQTWWDACAGQGGKTLHLGDLMQNRGLIWASDRVAWRLKELKRRAARARIFNYRVALWDGTDRLPTKTRFDGVLVDAPCTGTGTWHRNPHARWTTTPDDVRELSALQKQLLAHAASAVSPAGKLLYAVCTMTRAETTEVAEFFDKNFAEFARLELRNPLELASKGSPELWFWPQIIGGNGMFVAAWGKK